MGTVLNMRASAGRGARTGRAGFVTARVQRWFGRDARDQENGHSV